MARGYPPADQRYYLKNREAIILQTKLRHSGQRLPLAECRRMLQAQSTKKVPNER